MRYARLLRSKLFIFTFIAIVLSYILSLILIQWLISGNPPSSFGLLYAPSSTKFLPNYDDFVILWIGSQYSIAGVSGFEWLVIIDATTFILLLILAFTGAFNFALTNYAKISKSGAACGTFTGIAGLSLITSAISACPSCGTATAFVMAQAVIVAVTGYTVSFSALFTSVSNAIFITGIVINLVLLFIQLRRINKQKNLNISWKPITKGQK
ncbi:MAG TPA: hypothetical protein VKU94_01815 [Geobacterales bacterium]|nr:hypothetical protein [Geobacterales bacterium]